MTRVLVVPAAGLGTRLGSAVPKLLVPVAGVPMIDRLLQLYDGYVGGVVVVVHPQAEDAVRAHLSRASRIEFVVQVQPTGMLDAILLAVASPAAKNAAVWITWCDQVAVHPRTVQRLAETTEAKAAAAVVLPTIRRSDPYIHFERDGNGRISRVLHRREGDAMPARGESDMGLFALSREAAATWLPEYSNAIETGRRTGERNFLPFIPWVARRAEVWTFPSEHPMEAVGVNTIEDLQHVETYLASRPT